MANTIPQNIENETNSNLAKGDLLKKLERLEKGPGITSKGKEPPCKHNSWDNVRIVKGQVTLRCRVCQAQWRTAVGSAWRKSKCGFFNSPQGCSEGANCNKIHIHSKKQSLEERVAHHGLSLVLPGVNEEEDTEQDNKSHSEKSGKIASLEQPCNHNLWDFVRAKKKVATLRCRKCDSQWRIKLSDINRCPAFPNCERENCPMLHIFPHRQSNRTKDDAEVNQHSCVNNNNTDNNKLTDSVGCKPEMCNNQDSKGQDTYFITPYQQSKEPQQQQQFILQQINNEEKHEIEYLNTLSTLKTEKAYCELFQPSPLSSPELQSQKNNNNNNNNNNNIDKNMTQYLTRHKECREQYLNHHNCSDIKGINTTQNTLLSMNLNNPLQQSPYSSTTGSSTNSSSGLCLSEGEIGSNDSAEETLLTSSGLEGQAIESCDKLEELIYESVTRGRSTHASPKSVCSEEDSQSYKNYNDFYRYDYSLSLHSRSSSCPPVISFYNRGC